MRSTWKAADVELVAEYLRAPAPGTVLCLVATEAPTRFKSLFARLVQPLVGI